ncbi:hypothetical protein VHA_000192 [Grimontia hollisae CIP 101886]|uniref:Uncharacterized protein n=1 Tax=Grimontia hollisae CIP 101886 TaxID=675812 RepID=D0I361_GRIHO|nr:hypothetical protein VHA_000192 [Grimontia hollisae CIP 101886]
MEIMVNQVGSRATPYSVGCIPHYVGDEALSVSCLVLFAG